MIKRSLVASIAVLTLLTAGSPVELAAMRTPTPTGDYQSGGSCPKNLLFVVCVTFHVLFGDGSGSGTLPPANGNH